MLHAKLLLPICLNNWLFIYSLYILIISFSLPTLSASHHFFMSLALLTVAHSLKVTARLLPHLLLVIFSFPSPARYRILTFFLLFFFLEIRFGGFWYFLGSFSINGFMNMIFFLCQMRRISTRLRFWIFFNIKLMHFNSYFDDISTVFDRFSMDIRCIVDALHSERLKCNKCYSIIFWCNFDVFSWNYWIYQNCIEILSNCIKIKLKILTSNVLNVYQIASKTIEIFIEMHR